MKTFDKHCLVGLWAIASALSIAIADDAGTNEIKRISGKNIRLGRNQIDTSSLQSNLDDASIIKVQLYGDGELVEFRQEPMNVAGWVGKEGERLMKLVKRDGKYSGSIQTEDANYYIDTLEDGTAYFETVNHPEDMDIRRNLENTTETPEVCPEGKMAFDLELKTDKFGHETKWTLVDTKTKETVLAGGPYDSELEFLIHECVDEAKYKFTIYDAGRDGLCCDFGKGGYNVTFDDFGTFTGLDFKDECETHLFGGFKGFHLPKFSSCSKKLESKSAEEAAFESGLPCKDWCSDNDLPWIAEPGEYQKCDWNNTCAGCSECFSGFEEGEEENGDVEDNCGFFCRAGRGIKNIGSKMGNGLKKGWDYVKKPFNPKDKNEDKDESGGNSTDTNSTTAVALEDEEPELEEENCGFFCRVARPFKRAWNYVSKKFSRKKDKDMEKDDSGSNSTDTNSTETTETDTDSKEKDEKDKDKKDKNAADTNSTETTETDADSKEEDEEDENASEEEEEDEMEEAEKTETAPALAKEFLVEPSPNCKDWCYKMKNIPWNAVDENENSKCGWTEHCSGCDECLEDEQ